MDQRNPESSLLAENTFPECPGIIRKVELGGLSKSELLRELKRKEVFRNGYAEMLFAHDSFTISESIKNLMTIEVSVLDLGFPQGATSEHVFERADQLGLNLCPQELAPFLRLQYTDQPEGYWIVIASETLVAEDEFPNGFYLRRIDGKLWLRGYCADPQHNWDDEDRFIFVVSDRLNFRRKEHETDLGCS